MENFDLMAKNYDTDSRMERAKVIANKIRLHVTSGKEKSAMEYGCGTGLIGLELASIFKSLLLVDSSYEMILQAEKKINEINIENVSALYRDITVSFEDIPQFDYIFMSLVLHHIKDTKLILTNLNALLNKGGHLLIVDLNKEDGSFHAKYPDFDGHNGFEQTKLIDLLENSGYSNVSSETFYHGSKEFENNLSTYSLFILDAEK